MNKNNSIIMGIGAMLTLIISLPLEWMTIHNARMQFSGGFQRFGERMSSSLGGMSVKVTGINGHITFLAKLPVWLIVVVGLIGTILAFLNCLRVASLPKFVPLIPLSISALYVVVALLITIGSSEATVGVGVFVALTGLVLGYIHALTYRVAAEENTTL
ncbi:MAG: hypothetical protein ACYS8Z_25125 [Planctomycetota bacterium]